MPTYIRLTDYKSSEEKEQGFFKPENRYEAKQEDFEKIPGSPIAYWVSDRVKEIFEKSVKLSELALPKVGLQTGNNDRFLRYWNEVAFNKIGIDFPNRKTAKESGLKWFPYNKGGEFRKWYGNQEYIVNWENDGFEIQNFVDTNGKLRSRPQNLEFMFKKGITWSFVSSSNFGVRYTPKGFLFDVGGSSVFPSKDKILYITSFLISNIAFAMLKIVAPTINFQVGDLKALPLIFPQSSILKSKIEDLTQQNIDISKEEWDNRETSWDFKASPLLIENGELKIENGKIEDAYNAYCDYWQEKFFQLHANEEELNRLFIEIYELEDELTPDVPLEDITILKNEAKIIDGELVFQADEIMKQFVSYGVGVMFGRYSLDHEGLHIANQNETIEEANAKFGITTPTFEADDDNVIPVLDGDWFTDNISERFLQFVKVTFGEEHYEENVKFIEDALGKSIRKYFLKDFYTDHIRRYKKRPIYWMFSSPKGSFQALIYMHRYKSDTVSVVLNDYLRNFITKLEATKENLEAVGISASATKNEKTKAIKEIEKIKKMLIELNDYEKEILYPLATQKIEIDLDDGVKHNYPLFGKALKKVAGLS